MAEGPSAIGRARHAELAEWRYEHALGACRPAAVCVAHGLTMVTGNVHEVVREPGLELEVTKG